MIWAEKLRELTLGSKFKIEEVAGLLKVETNEGFKIFQELAMNCYVRPSTNGKWVCMHGKERQEHIEKSLEICEMEIRDKYALLTHLKSLKDEKKD